MTPQEQLQAIANKYNVNPQNPIAPTQSGTGLDSLRQKLANPTQQVIKNPQLIDNLTRMKQRGIETNQDIKQIGTDIVTSLKTRGESVQQGKEAMQRGEQSGLRTFGQTLGQGAGVVSDALGSIVTGAVKLPLSQKTETGIKEIISDIATPVVQSTPVQSILSKYETLKQTNPALARDIDSALGIASLGLDVAGVGVAGKTTKAGAKVAKETGEQLLKTGKQLVDDIIPPGGGTGASAVTSEGGSGVVQIVSDIADRVPRAASRIKQNIATASERSAKIKTSTPAIQSAMKSNLDDRIINTIDSADDATRKAYKDVVDIAQEQSTKLGTKTQPTKVGGDLAAEQYSIIDKQKKTIGAKLGEETKKLSQNADIEMGDSYSIIDDTLSSQGIMPQYTKKGVKLDFSGSKYTPAERTKIQELYKLATEGGDKLSAKSIREKDQLFSKLKREANFEGVGNIIIDTLNGQRSLFDVFRDVYSSKLDTLSPEIKALNSQYRKLSNLTDDIESSIFKTPNFQATKTVDPAEFAKVNLRRIFGESQSSPAYEAIADAMDATSRSLGYKGASPKVVAEFAQEMRKLFPDTIPATGFSGGVKLGIGDIIEKVTSLGATNLTDKQKAIVELLESYQKAKKLNIRNK
jgi:hypothetical protein